MSFKVMEYFDENPGTTQKDAILFFANELAVDEQLTYLRQEVDKVLEIRAKLRPLYGKKMNSDTNMALVESELDMAVMVRYPPRQGSDKERKAYLRELQMENDDYNILKQQIDEVKEEIAQLEEEMNEVQQRAKNARRIIETFNVYVHYITTCTAEEVMENPNLNQNLF